MNQINKKEKENIEKFLIYLVDLKKKHPNLKIYFIVKEDEEKNKLKSLLCIS